MVSAQPDLHEQLRFAKLELNTFKQDQFSPYPAQVSTPAEWFSKLFPAQVKCHGCPFIELREQVGDFQKITPLSVNVDFFAAILGGDRAVGHQVIYFEPEMQFYYRDSDFIFRPTTDEKLGNLIRALLVRCAQEMPKDVHLLNLFHEFRTDPVIRSITRRAKSILAANSEFFSVRSPHQRINGPELHERIAKVFIEELLERKEGAVLQFSQAYDLFTGYAKKRSLDPIKRSMFKTIVVPLIRDNFDLGLRNDLLVQGIDKQLCGWKGLSAIDVEAKA